MLPITHRSKTRLGSRVVSLLLMTAALVWILPTLRGGDSLSAQSDMAVAAAGGTEAEKADADAPAPGGAAAIRGAWRAVRIEQAREEATASAVRQLTMVFDEKRLVMRVGQQLVADAPYTVDASQNPPTVKLTYAGQANHGIWERKADTLTLCLADVDQARPKKFAVGPEGGKVLMVLQVPQEQGEIIPLLVIDADGKNLRPLVALMPSASKPHAERIFAVFDKNHDKKLDFPEFADRSGEGWFLLLDRNEDGAVSQDELVQGYPDLVRNKHLIAVFALLDKNRDGKLILAEFRPGVESAEVLFYRQDKDGDGRLALEEYKIWVQTPEGRLALKKEFEAKDKNKDGKLTLAEYLGSK